MKIGLALIAALPLVVNAQNAAKAPTAIRATVGDITDNRTTGSFNSECKVELKFTGDEAADSGVVRDVFVKEAIDEAGRDLVMKSDDRMFSHSYSSMGSRLPKAEVVLRNPSRNATVIKRLSGEVEMFKPTEANGGLLVISNALQHPAEPITNAAFAKYNITLMYLTKEAYEAKKKEFDEQQKSGDPSGMAAAFGDMFKGMFGGMTGGSKNSLQFYVKDPQKRIIEIKFRNSKGESLEQRESWSSGEFKNYGFKTMPGADTQLVIQLATPESLKKIPFEVENIPLP